MNFLSTNYFLIFLEKGNQNVFQIVLHPIFNIFPNRNYFPFKSAFLFPPDFSLVTTYFLFLPIFSFFWVSSLSLRSSDLLGRSPLMVQCCFLLLCPFFGLPGNFFSHNNIIDRWKIKMNFIVIKDKNFININRVINILINFGTHIFHNIIYFMITRGYLLILLLSWRQNPQHVILVF